MSRGFLAAALMSLLASAAWPAPGRHTFTLSATDFLLDGAPFRILSCEMHPVRIPAEYWSHRIRMAKAMGCNTIAAYIFWNAHEEAEGRFDFATGNRDIARFLKVAQAEGLWVILRPGPYLGVDFAADCLRRADASDYHILSSRRRVDGVAYSQVGQRHSDSPHGMTANHDPVR